jgi:hypothetical protein
MDGKLFWEAKMKISKSLNTLLRIVSIFFISMMADYWFRVIRWVDLPNWENTVTWESLSLQPLFIAVTIGILILVISRFISKEKQALFSKTTIWIGPIGQATLLLAIILIIRFPILISKVNFFFAEELMLAMVFYAFRPIFLAIGLGIILPIARPWVSNKNVDRSTSALLLFFGVAFIILMQVKYSGYLPRVQPFYDVTSTIVASRLGASSYVSGLMIFLGLYRLLERMGNNNPSL